MGRANFRLFFSETETRGASWTEEPRLSLRGLDEVFAVEGLVRSQRDASVASLALLLEH
jgi:hypothetical protein